MPRAGVVDVKVGGHNVIVTRESNGMLTGLQHFGMRYQTLKPLELVIKVRPGLRIFSRKIEASNDHAMDSSFQVTRLRVVFSTRQALTNQKRLRVARKNVHSVP